MEQSDLASKDAAVETVWRHDGGGDVVLRLKRASSPPLPGGPGLRRGCLSGRGQAQAEDGHADRALLRQVEGIYAAIPVWPPETSAHVQELYQEWLWGDSPWAQVALHTA
ncbi:hypothetical protein QTO34_006873 [Cnephaeus nilssonii]|uniref:Iron hydrogenase small subunit domain-containing protein n=1 Tax=Cnephaeus nilssonii TaxID=3371016 RepID=A0AA40HJ82_CNENI|nr:hypothetical protein QTO34_006873 [Eptesicus nilssonii]